jgi:hypothetical protein
MFSIGNTLAASNVVINLFSALVAVAAAAVVVFLSQF